MKLQINSCHTLAGSNSLSASLRGMLLILSALITSTVMCFGQGVTGRIQGTVQDGTGAVVPKATITVTNQETGVSSRYTSSSQGEYIANLLSPGNYNIEVTAAGFRTTVSTGNVVTVDNATRADVILQLGGNNRICPGHWGQSPGRYDKFLDG
jgi:hypothetical protein